MRLSTLLEGKVDEQDDGDKASDYSSVDAWKKDAKSSDYKVFKSKDEDGNEIWVAKDENGKKVGGYYPDDENGWLD